VREPPSSRGYSALRPTFSLRRDTCLGPAFTVLTTFINSPLPGHSRGFTSATKEWFEVYAHFPFFGDTRQDRTQTCFYYVLYVH
jgi:hypothetical protein